MDPKEGPVEDEELDEETSDDEFPEDIADGDDEEEPAPAAAEPPEEGEASLDELLTSQAGGEEEEDESVLSFVRDERIETLSVKVVPQQPTEFTCRKCYLVKHRSQLADKKRMLCRDCA